VAEKPDRIFARCASLFVRPRTAVAPSDGHLWVDDRETEDEQRLTAAWEVEHPAAETMLVSNLATRAVIQPTTPYWVYDGDRPSPYGTVCRDLPASAQAALDEARTEPDGARQILRLLTMGRLCATRAEPRPRC
jgi:hypothetical protein